MVIFYKKWKKFNEIQLAKNKMDLNNRKITNYPPSPEHQILKSEDCKYVNARWLKGLFFD